MAQFLNSYHPRTPRKTFTSAFSKTDVNLEMGSSAPPLPGSVRIMTDESPLTDMTGSLGDCDETGGPFPVQAGESRSIEIFFGKFTTFHTFHQALCDQGVSVPGQVQDVFTTKVCPDAIRKLVMVGHPMTSFAGMGRFAKLSEAWVTNCNIGEGKWSDFEGMKSLHKLYIYNCCLDKLEALHFQSLKTLWVSGNNLQSLSFLGAGLPTLVELNAAMNEVTCLLEEQLFKCVSLQTLNLSGNPLCTVQDVVAVKVLPGLLHLHLADPLYGKCPVAALCDGRTMLLNILPNVISLDGKTVSPAETKTITDYVNSRSLYYYANLVLGVAKKVTERRGVIGTTYKNMERIGYRLGELLTLGSQYRRAMDSVDAIPVFTNAKNILRDHLVRVEARANKLRELAIVGHKRLETIMQISRWEQELEKWMKWIDYHTGGNTQCHIIQSVHGARVDDAVNLCGTIHQLISALACPNLWPSGTMTKVESVIVLKDKGMEAGMERTYEDYYAKRDDPPFVPPPPEPLNPQEPLMMTLGGQTCVFPFYGLPVPPTKPIPTYTKPDYKPAPSNNPFPDSIPGLPEKLEPLFMFLVCPPISATNPATVNPLSYLHRVITEKSHYYRDIRVTNCLWMATTHTRGLTNFSVVVVVKVLPHALQAIQCDKRMCTQHSWDCTTFCMKRPLTISPAYVLNISFTPEDKQAQWHKGTPNDDDVMIPAKTALTNLAGKVHSHKFPPGTKRRSKKSPFIRKVCDGIHADLSAVQLNVAKDGTVEPIDPLSPAPIKATETQSSFNIQNVSKFLGLEASQYLTSLDLSVNKLGLTVGLEGLYTLKKLNLSHNNLTTLSGLHQMPNLIELKVGWNYLRFLHSNACTLAYTAPRLMTLEILPNPLQDVRDYAHIPILLRKFLPALHRVDIWTSPFDYPSPLNKFTPPTVADSGFAHIAMANSWGTAYLYNDLSGRCLTDLDCMPLTPPFPEGFGSNGMDLNLSDNYLHSPALIHSPFVQSAEWRTSLVTLQLQENMISTLEWLKDNMFPNVQILNLSNNYLTEVDLVTQSFPALRYLQLCGNPLECDVNILSPIRLLLNLGTLDCSGSPLASHPDYGGYVSRFLPAVHVLDGTPIANWDLGESVERVGGILSQDWLEDRLGHRNFNSLTQLTFPNANLQKIRLPSSSLTKLVSVDLQDNNLSSLSNLASLTGLRVLCASHNCIAALGNQPCPTCYSHTAESQAMNAHKLRRPGSKSSGRPEGIGPLTIRFNGQHEPISTFQINHTKYTPPPGVMPVRKRPLFPKLEVLIMAHNGMSALNDLHLHAMPHLQTVILNCNNLTNLQGLSDLPTVKALVLDHNRIKDIPRDSLTGCDSLRYLHLEHNRIAAVPRLPHLTNLTSLYLSYNKIQCMTDVSSIAGTAVTDMTLTGNPISTRSDYRLNLKARIPQLTSLDGRDLGSERIKLEKLKERWFPGSVNVIREYASHDPVFRPQNVMSIEKPGQFDQESEFGLKVRSLSPHLATASPRSLQFSGFKPAKRTDFL